MRIEMTDALRAWVTAQPDDGRIGLEIAMACDRELEGERARELPLRCDACGWPAHRGICHGVTDEVADVRD